MDSGQINYKAKDLLFLLGEEIKQPLVAISQLSEMNGDEGVNIHAKKALRTIDNVMLYQQVNSGQRALKLEPVHVGSAMQEVSVAMQPLMRSSGCRTEMIIQHSLSPVDVDRRLLHGALQSLWQALLGTMHAPAEVVCRAHRTSKGIRLSMLSVGAQVGSMSLKNTNLNSSQPITSVAGPATDLLTAHGMFNILGGNLTKTSGKKLSGFGVTLKTSKQLQMLV